MECWYVPAFGLFYVVSKALIISSATVGVHTVGAIWLNPFATVLFNVCSAVIECCVLYPCCVGAFDVYRLVNQDE